MKKNLAQPPVTLETFRALHYLFRLPDQVLRDRYLSVESLEQGKGGILLKAMRRQAELTNTLLRAFLAEVELKEIDPTGELTPFQSFAESSLAYRAMAATLYQYTNFNPLNTDSNQPNLYFRALQEKFSSFEEFWCAVEWDLLYRHMCKVGLIVDGEEIQLQGKRKWADQANQLFQYLDDPSKIRLDSELKMWTASEALFSYAVYLAQRDEQFHWQQFSVFMATLKRCHRELRNSNHQVCYLLENGDLVIFEKHGKKAL